MVLLHWTIIFSSLLISNHASTGNPEANGTLVVQVSHPDATSGKVLMAVYNRENGFLDKGGHIFGRRLNVEGTEDVIFHLEGLMYGEYALALFHDLNGNGKFDTNILGIPMEPYAFSNNVRAKWSKPKFEEARVQFYRSGQKLEINLKRWRHH